MKNRYYLGWRSWLPGVIGWLGLAILVIGLGIKNSDLLFYFIGVIFIVLSALTVFTGLNSWMEICVTGIGGHWNNQKYFIPWRAIHAVWVEDEDASDALLRLGTDLGMIMVSLRGLPSNAILRDVRLRLSSGVQTTQAQQLYMARRQIAQRTAPLRLKLPVTVIHSKRLRFVLFCTTLFWLVFIFLYMIYNPYAIGLLVCSLFLTLNLAGNLLLSERVELDSQGITQYMPFSSLRISWDEIEKVRMGSTGQTVVIEGQGKRLVLSGLRHWDGSQALAARRFFLYQLENHEISPNLDRWIEFKVLIPDWGSR